MYIHTDTAEYGKVDHLPGLLCVTTKFGRIYGLPVLPVESRVVVDGMSFDSGQAIPLSWSSVLVCYGQWLAPIAAFFSTAYLLSQIFPGEGKPAEDPSLIAMPIAVVSWAAIFYYLVKVHLFGTKPTPIRAVELARVLGISTDLLIDFYLDDPQIELLANRPKDDAFDSDTPQKDPNIN